MIARRSVHFVAILCAAALPLAGSSDYLDPAVCAQCHRAIAESYAQTAMGRSVRSVTAGATLPEFDGKIFAHRASDQLFVPYQKGGHFYLRRYQEGPGGSIRNNLEKSVDYIFGSGNHARSYLHRTPAGKLIELPLTWYSENGGYWGMSPAYDRPDHAGFSRTIAYGCMFCHNGYPDIAAGADEWVLNSEFPRRLPEGIDCQRCHGPGRSHALAAQRAASQHEIRDAVVNPARLRPDRQIEICMQCHLETTSSRLPATLLRDGRGVFSYRPSEPLANYILHFDHAPASGHDGKFELVSAAYRLRKSACFQKSATLTCTTCHNPHQTLRGAEAVRHYTQVCRQCHGGALAKLALEQRHPAAEECVSCHMPRRRPADAIHTVITDHRIAARPAAVAAPAQEEHDGNTSPYAGEVTLYYPPSLPRNAENELDLALAQVAQQSNVPEGLTRLEKLLRQYSPTGRAETFFQLADTFFQTGQASRAIPFYREAVKRAPERWRYEYALGMALATAGQPEASRDSLKRARSLAPREPVILFALADLEFRRNKLPETISLLKEAIALDPDTAEGPNNLGNALLRIGDLDGARAAFREAVRLRPEKAAIHLNLASLLSREGNLAESKYHLEAAIRIGPSAEVARSAYLSALAVTADVSKARAQYAAVMARQLSDAHNNLGTVLVALGDSQAAIQHYRTAVAAQPDSATAHLNLGLTLAGQGSGIEARQHLERALEHNPNLYEAHLKLGELLLSQGDSARAAAHLRRALACPDPLVRKAATDLLATIQ